MNKNKKFKVLISTLLAATMTAANTSYVLAATPENSKAESTIVCQEGVDQKEQVTFNGETYSVSKKVLENGNVMSTVSDGKGESSTAIFNPYTNEVSVNGKNLGNLKAPSRSKLMPESLAASSDWIYQGVELSGNINVAGLTLTAIAAAFISASVPASVALAVAAYIVDHTSFSVVYYQIKVWWDGNYTHPGMKKVLCLYSDPDFTSEFYEATPWYGKR